MTSCFDPPYKGCLSQDYTDHTHPHVQDPDLGKQSLYSPSNLAQILIRILVQNAPSSLDDTMISCFWERTRKNSRSFCRATSVQGVVKQPFPPSSGHSATYTGICAGMQSDNLVPERRCSTACVSCDVMMTHLKVKHAVGILDTGFGRINLYGSHMPTGCSSGAFCAVDAMWNCAARVVVSLAFIRHLQVRATSSGTRLGTSESDAVPYWWCPVGDSGLKTHRSLSP